jgi:regulator of PEP synthase PpsR (kinase-PPPase family)
MRLGESPRAPVGTKARMKQFHLHLLSDATGETVASAARACVSQFENVEPIEHFWNLVRTERQLTMVLQQIEANPGPVIFTMVDPVLRSLLEERCRELKVPCIPMLDAVFTGLADFLGERRLTLPGRQHVMNDDYFSRIDAMDFALSNDDGQSPARLEKADVILVGVSRTSKTPTCIYLANRGIKAANVPFVPGRPLPDSLFEVKKPLIVGLTSDPNRLLDIRRNRLRSMKQAENINYVDPEVVEKEVLEAKRLYARMGWPTIDVTRRSVEETAAEIINILSRRQTQGAAAASAASPTAGPIRE